MDLINKIDFLPATVGHKRLWPKVNAFRYKVFYIRVPIQQKLNYKLPKLLSFNHWNFLSLYAKDHLLAANYTDWYTYIRAALKSGNIYFDEKKYKIYLIALPRVFGFVFNPISYWIIVDGNNLLRAVLCEVHSTFKQSHNYLLAKPDGTVISPQDIFIANKKLYVSPFNKNEGYYEFQFTYSQDSFKSVINYYNQSGKHILNTYLGGAWMPLDSAKIIFAIFTYPAMTVLVVLRIHMQALRLFFKGLKNTLRERSNKYTNNETSLVNKIKKVSLKST